MKATIALPLISLLLLVTLISACDPQKAIPDVSTDLQQSANSIAISSSLAPRSPPEADEVGSSTDVMTSSSSRSSFSSSSSSPSWRTFRKPSDAELKSRLTPLQYDVTQHEGTERPYDNAYHDYHEEGIYVDIVSGEPLFSSLDKFDSGTGWPSFTKPLEPQNIVEKTDTQLFLPRTEIRSKIADSHLGHVFNDGPPPTRLRYCMNSASLRFIPKEKLAEEGYGEYVSLFESTGDKN